MIILIQITISLCLKPVIFRKKHCYGFHHKTEISMESLPNNKSYSIVE